MSLSPSEADNTRVSDPCQPLDALLFLPPLVKYTAGPLLGPAMLAGAARSAGFSVETLDYNILWLRAQDNQQLWQPDVAFFGDHDRPPSLAEVERTWLDRVRCWLGPPPDATNIHAHPASALLYSMEEVLAAAKSLVASPEGRALRAELSTHRPARVVGLSIMFSGQVLWALATARIARDLWPDALIVAGGAHVTALQDCIVEDQRYGSEIDRFVFGYAEQTFVQLLHAVRNGGPLPEACVQAGSRAAPSRATGDLCTIPEFPPVGAYRPVRPTLPGQFSRGCAYAKCAYCTYPAIEGAYAPGPAVIIDQLARIAASTGAALSLKDSLVTSNRLKQVSEIVGGRAPWSACTKLGGWMNKEGLKALAGAGCRTLELGIETFVESSQLLIDKRQDWETFRRALESAGAAGISLVINMITGFPGESVDAALQQLDRVREAVERSLGPHGKIEHNRFELERLAPMARSGSLRTTRSWPWSSLLDWEPNDRRSLQPLTVRGEVLP